MTKTHCRHGHDLAVAGVYMSRTPRKLGGFTESQVCRQCSREQSARAAVRARARKAKTQTKGGAVHHVDEVREVARTLQIDTLIEAKWRASMVWERRAIQAQIDALSSPKGSACISTSEGSTQQCTSASA